MMQPYLALHPVGRGVFGHLVSCNGDVIRGANSQPAREPPRQSSPATARSRNLIEKTGQLRAG